MKNEYISPVLEAIEIDTETFLATSSTPLSGLSIGDDIDDDSEHYGE